MPPSTPTLPRAPCRPPPRFYYGTDTETVRARAASLCIGERAFLAGVPVRRTSLLTYDVAGFKLDLDEVAAEITYLATERRAIQDEPSLRRAAEIVGRQVGRGSFSVGIERYVGRVPIWEATWESRDWKSTPADDRDALDQLAAWACDMGVKAARVGYHVVAPMPLADRPSFVRATHPQSRVSYRQPKGRAA